MSTDTLLYEDVPEYDFWLKLILGGILAITFIPGIVLLSQEIEAAIAMFAVTLFDAILFKAILPRRFQIFEDRLRILLGGPLAINIPLSNIAEVKTAEASKTFIYTGIRLATSSRRVVEIVRKRGLNLVISPAHDDMFLEQLNQARQDNSVSNLVHI